MPVKTLLASLCLLLSLTACGSTLQPHERVEVETGRMEGRPTAEPAPRIQTLDRRTRPDLTTRAEQIPEQRSGFTGQRRPQGQPAVASPVRVAILLPLSGSNGALGRQMLDAAQMAVFDVGDSGFVLMPRDTEGTADGARRAAANAIADGADVILGPLFATSVAAIAPQARAAGVNVIAFSTDWTLAGDNIYIMGFMPFAQVSRVISYAALQGVRELGVLLPETLYGDAVEASLRRDTALAGITITKMARYVPDDPSMAPIIKEFAEFERRQAEWAEVKAELEQQDDEASRQALAQLELTETFGDLPFDAVMIAEGGERLKLIAPLLPFYDVDPRQIRFLGTGLWDDPSITRESALVGGWFAAPAPGPREDFETRFAAMYGQTPPRLATLGYDATALAAVLARTSGGRTGRMVFSADRLTDRRGFFGVDGVFRFRTDGLVERGLSVLEVRRDGLRTVDPAPTSFAPDPQIAPEPARQPGPMQRGVGG